MVDSDILAPATARYLDEFPTTDEADGCWAECQEERDSVSGGCCCSSSPTMEGREEAEVAGEMGAATVHPMAAQADHATLRTAPTT